MLKIKWHKTVDYILFVVNMMNVTSNIIDFLEVFIAKFCDIILGGGGGDRYQCLTYDVGKVIEKPNCFIS